MQSNVTNAEWSTVTSISTEDRCYCQYCEAARWLKRRKPVGSRRMLIVLRRHHAREQKKAAAETAAG